MRLSIRWKLILSIVIPLLIISFLVRSYTFEKINQYSLERNKQQATTQARIYAARLNDRFEKIAQQAHASAELLEILPEPDEINLYRILEGHLKHEPLIFGSAIAFEPNRFREHIRLFAPYMFRGPDGLKKIDIGTEGYDYTEEKRTWYSGVRDTGVARWTDPYFDDGAGNILMNTYSVPFYRDGGFAGVVTVDVSLKDLSARLEFGNDNNYPFIIVNRKGQFVSHPDPEMIMQADVTGQAEQFNNPALKELAEKLITGGNGIIQITEPGMFQSDETFWIFFAPIQSTGWSFAMAIPESDVLGYIQSQIQRGTVGFFVTIVLIVICILIIGSTLTRPITKLNQAVKTLAQGDLNHEIQGIRSKDELGELAQGFNIMVAQLRRHVHALTRETAARESYETEMQFAHQVQASLLPDDEQPLGHDDKFQLYGINRPARHVAGDFYDYFLLDDRRLILIIGDVSGKGMASALLMAVTRTIVRNQARAGRTPAEILAEANRLIIETNMRSLFVTMFVASYDIETGEIIYANAGHPRPFILCCDDLVTRFGDTTGTIVGMLEEAEYTEATEQLNPGDALILYTDGIPDARSPDGQFFGEDNFIDLLKISTGKSVREICEYTVDVLMGYQGNSLKDDTTLLILKRSELDAAS